MSYALARRSPRGLSLGEAVAPETAPVPVTDPSAPQLQPHEMIAQSSTHTALAIMGLAAMPWVPVFVGGWATDKLGYGKGWGALAGFAVSFFSLRNLSRKMSGG